MDNFDLRKYLAENKLLKEDQLVHDILGNQVEVENEKKVNSKIALDRMLNLPK